MKIVVLDGYTLCPGDIDFTALEALGEVNVYDRTPVELICERIGDAQIVLTNKTPITRAVMDACPDMRYVGVLATGYNIVDIAAASEKNIVVTNVPAYSTQAVAQHVMALLLCECSRVHVYDARVKEDAWTASKDFCFYAAQAEELAGQTLGIIGFGSIGQQVARAAMGLGMRVIAHSRTAREGWHEVAFVGLDELLASSDVISLHCPLTEQTNGLIGKKAISAMKKGVRVINTARGPLVDEAAMAAALCDGHVRCYMTDVLSSEPPKADNPLLAAPNTIITPHVAWAPLQTRKRLLNVAVGNVAAYLSGEPRNVVSRIG